MPDIDLDSPTFSVTGTALTNETASSWLFGNPIRDTLNASMTAINNANSGLLVQNSNFQQASGGAGILRTMNQALVKAQELAKANSVAVSWALAILGVVAVAKVVKGGGSRGRR
jgi:hypothetical protein